MFFAILEILRLGVVLLPVVRIQELHEQLVVRVFDVAVDPLLDLLFAEGQPF